LDRQDNRTVLDDARTIHLSQGRIAAFYRRGSILAADRTHHRLYVRHRSIEYHEIGKM
jgi:hypothetical protein